MIRDIKIMKQMGLSHETLREIFTAKPFDEEHDKEEDREAIEKKYQFRKDWEDRIDGRLREGITWSVKNSRLYQAVDIAWDSTPIRKETIPLLLYAQGKVNFESCLSSLKKLDCADEFTTTTKDEESGEDVIKISLPRLYEVSVNIIRSYITRRVAAQSARFTDQYPFFKYEPRGTTPVDKLRADILNKRVEIMTDQFGYRHLFGAQTIRDQFLYARSLVFPLSSWTIEKQLVKKRTPSSAKTEEPETVDGKEPKIVTETKIMKEGIEFYNPHPSRYFWDNSYPLANINIDSGPRFLGYWDVIRFSDIKDDTSYYNRDSIGFSSENMMNLPGLHSNFFNYYFDPCAIKFNKSAANEAGQENDRKTNVGVYTSDIKDDAMFFTHYFEKINPLGLGIGTYPHDVWIKLQVAADKTVVNAEPLPSIPAAYGGINENDNRVINNSMAHDIMPFQDQLTNIFSQMLLNMKTGLLQIWQLDKDLIDDDIITQIRKGMKAEDFYSIPKLVVYSGTKYRDMGLNPKTAIDVAQANVQVSVNESLKAVSSLLSMVERLLILSPQELAQPAPREISATEVTVMANSTNSIFQFISEGSDEQRSAVKNMIYDGLLSMGKDEIRLATSGRYTASIIEDAGFQVVASGDDDPDEEISRTIIGNPEDLRHDVLFTSRDGSERQTNLQAAQILTQLVQTTLSIPEMQQKLGDEKLFEVMNEIGRLSGANLNLEVTEQEPSRMEQILQALEALDGRVQQTEQATGLAPIPPPEGEVAAQPVAQ